MSRILRAAIVAALVGLPACAVHANGPHATTPYANWGPTHPGMIHAWGYQGHGQPPYGPGQLDAALYPCPRPDIPYEVGGTLITNPAFDPHEMLYPHVYRGVYGPFYYKKPAFSSSGYLIGTEVRVKYRGHYSPFSFFFPPRTTICR